MKIPFGKGAWINDLRFDDERKKALIAHVGVFRNCTTIPEGKRHAILSDEEVEKGWIHYDVEEIVGLCNLRCVVIGNCMKRMLLTKMYCILVVRPTGVDGEYGRVGCGMIHSDYVVEDAFNMRIV